MSVFDHAAETNERRREVIHVSSGLVPLALALALAGTVSGGLPQVTVYGSIRQVVSQRDVAPKVQLGEVLRTPHAFGLGSLSDLRGEITIVDGTAWSSYPPAAPGAAPKVLVSSDSAERAGFLVTAFVDPGRWREVKLSAPISSDNLEAVLVKSWRRRSVSAASIRPSASRVSSAS